MRVWAIANQKGGVGKTTTTLALGRGLAMRGHRVLLVDLDPHASLTRAFGVATDPQPAGVLDLFDEQPPALASLARATEIENLSFIAAQTPLATLERRSHAWDFVLFDCPPTLGLLMVNALAAADHVIIPTQTEPLALHGLKGMCRTADMIQRSRHRVLPVSILPTLYDKRTRTGADTLKAMQDEYGERVWNDAIPNDTRICSADALTSSSPAAQYPGRGLSAYRRALDWLLLTEARDTEQAA